MAKDLLGGDFQNSISTNTSLGSEGFGGNSALYQQLEEEAVKVLAKLTRDSEFSGKLAEEVARALKENFGAIAQDKQEFSRRLENLLPAATTAQKIGAAAVQSGVPLSDEELQRIIQSAITAYNVIGAKKLEQIATKDLAPMLLANSVNPQNTSGVLTQLAAQTAFRTQPAETARQYMYGQLPTEYLLYGGAAITGIGGHVRRELLESRSLLKSSSDIPVDDSFREFLEGDYSEKIKKVKGYLEALQTQFDVANEELKKAVEVGDSKKAAELRRTLGSLSQEIVETTKTLHDTEQETKKKRQQAWGDLLGALSPIGRHAESSLGNPIVGLLKESFRVGVNTANAVGNLLSTNEGDGRGGGSGLLATLAAGSRAITGAGRAAIGLIAANPLVAAGTAAAGVGLGAAYLYNRHREQLANEQYEQNMGLLQKYYEQRGVPVDQLGEAARTTKEFSKSVEEAKSNVLEFGKSLAIPTAGLAAGGLVAANIAANGIEGILEQGVALGAGALAASVNFGLGAVDIGRQYLGGYWQGATGLNMRQYLQLSGGEQNIGSYLGGGVLGTEALRLGFGINDITRGYEVMQRGMPMGELSGQQMSQLLDENAKIARALGIRLEESLQLTTTMRRTFGTAEPQQMGGYIAALGADRTGNFENAFSKAIAQGFVEASRQMMMQGVAPEGAMAGFGALRNVFMAQGQPEYLRTLAETNPQFITSLTNTFSGRLRSAAAGGDPWTLGLALRSGMSFEQMARGGPEATMQMLDQIMQEFPLGLMAQGGRLTRTARELLSKYAAEMGQNPDIFIGYAEATLRGDTTRAREQFRAAYGRGAAWEAGLTPEGVQRSPMYEENMRIINQTTARLAETTETVMGTIAQINTSLLKFTDMVLSSGELIYEGVSKTMSGIGQFFGTEIPEGEGFGVKQDPTKVKIRVINNEEELEDAILDKRAEIAKQKFQEEYSGGFLTLPSSSPNTTTILEINGTVNVRQKAPSFVPEE